MPETIPEITRRYLSNKSLEEFVRGLGIEASKQMVWYWKMGRQKPRALTLFRIQASPRAENWAKQFATECVAALQREGEVLETEPDKEIERRR